MKKFLLIMTIFLCMTPTVFASDYMFNGEIVPATSTANDNFFGVETVVDVLEKLGYPYDDITKVSTTYYINEYMEYYKNNIDGDVKALNVCFLRNSETVTNASNIYILVGNGTFSNTLPYLYMIDTQIAEFYRWSKDFTGKIIGAETIDTSYGIVNKSAWSSSAGKITYAGESSQTTASVLNFNWIVAPVETYAIASRAPQTGYGYYFLENTYEFNDLSNSGDSGGNSGDSGGNSGGTTDLTMTNELINKINAQVEEISKKIPTSGEIAEIVPSSGDIEQATQNGVVQGNIDYWGSSGDLSGDQQEELISGKIDELTEQISGDLAENEIFSILKTYEDKLFGGFTGEQDFKISWNDISYAGGVIIPKGEVNFSEICRENESLGRVKTTVNIILGFMLLYNCVIYLYNLLLATLGIDNPYLYEKPQDVTTTSYSVDMNTGKTTETKTTKRKDGITFIRRRDI